MGIRICPECGGKVSDKRATCPHCNYKFEDTKKCPDCLEDILISATECPICGHPFKNENKNEEYTHKTIKVECPNCGSNKVIKENKNNYYCSSCESRFIIDDGKPTIIQKNNIINNIIKSGRKDDFIQIVNANDDIDKDEFIKEALISLNNNSTPQDIYDLEIIDTKIIKYKYIWAEGDATVNYSRTVGFDREEQYVDYEDKYDSSLGKNVRVPVTKTKTVTDWRVDNGILMDKQSNIIFSNDNIIEYASANDIIRSIFISQEDFINIKNSSNSFISNEDIEEVKDSILDKVYYRNINDMGDHIRNISYTGKVEDITYVIFTCPFYVLDFKYKNKDYYILSPAYKKIKIVNGSDFKFDPTDEDKIFNENKEKFNIRMEGAKKYMNMFLILWIFLLLFGLGSLFSNAGIGFIIAGSIMVGLSIPLLVLGIIISKKRNRYLSKKEDIIYAYNQLVLKRKKVGLNNKLSSLGYREYKEEEKCDINETINKLAKLYEESYGKFFKD